MAAMFASAAMISLQVAGKATRDALFLSSFEVTQLPGFSAGGALLSLASVFVFARLLVAYSPARVVPAVFGLNAALLAADWGLSHVSPELAAAILYLQFALFGAASISSFWSLVNERFDPHAAKKVVARIAGAGTFGGVVGGLLALGLARLVPPSAMLLVMGGLSLLCALSASSLAGAAASHPTGSPREDASASGLGALRGAPYLQALALLILLGSLGSSLVDYVLSARAAAAFGRGAELLSFFALFYMATGILTFVVQVALGRASLERLGLAGTVALAPAALLGGGALTLAVPGLLAAAVGRGLDAVTRSSLFRAGYELFYTPLPTADKRSTKTIIDVGFDRIGTIVGSGATMLILALVPSSPEIFLLPLAMASALAALSLTRRLHAGYVGALAEALRAGAVKLDPDAVEDATTRRTLAESMEMMNRTALLAEIEALRRSSDREGSEGPRSRRDSARSTKVDGPAASLSGAADLASGDRERAAAVLARTPFDPALLAYAIPLLADESLHLKTIRALRSVADRTVGQLTDAIVDPSRPAVVRARAARVLLVVPTERSLAGLSLGLTDPSLDVRRECAFALLRVTDKDRGLRVPRDAILAAAKRAIEEGDASAARVELVFVLLGLVFEREPLRIAYRALFQSDERLRGTALEYLDNVLPPELREAMQPMLLATRSLHVAPSSRAAQGDLARSMAALSARSAHLAIPGR